MGSSRDDAAGVLLLLFITLMLCFTVLVLGIAFVILLALLFLCWVLTYWLLRLINEVVTDHWITESEGLLALVIPFFLYAGLTWWFFPREWASIIAISFGWSLLKTWSSLIVSAGLLGLSLGFLSLPMLENGDSEDEPVLETTGMLKLPDGKSASDWNDENWEAIEEGVLLGEDM